MVTINGVKAQNLQALNEETTKKPTMNEVLSRMQANFDQLSNTNQPAQNEQNFSNNEKNVNTQSKSPLDNISSMFQGENSILLSLLPMLLSKDKSQSQNIGQEIMMKMLANSGNTMLSKIVGMLPKINKKNSIQNTEQNITEASKIDAFAKVE